MELKPETKALLERGGWKTKEDVAQANPIEVRMALGRDNQRIREVLNWLTDNKPGEAYKHQRLPRDFLDGLFPPLKQMWARIRGLDKGPDRGA